MGTETLTQMNVRMGSQLKLTGDEALSSIGFTPTQAVRTLWQYAALRGEALEEVRQLLMKAKRGAAQAEAGPSALEAGWRIIPDGMAQIGISAEAMARAVQDDTSLIDGARNERAKQKGWL